MRRNKKPSEALIKAREEHRKFLRSMGIDPLHKIERGRLVAEERVRKELPPLSNAAGNGFVKSVDDWKWKGKQESAQTIKAIEDKKKRIGMHYPKGAMQYLTDETDLFTMSRKV